MRLNGQYIRYCVEYCITSIIYNKAFLIKLFKNFEEQEEDFFNVSSDSSVKNSAIQLEANKTIKLKYFNVLNVGVPNFVKFYLSFIYLPILKISSVQHK